MNESYPFFSNTLEVAGAGIYHTHPRCRIAQSIGPAARVAGTGEGRHECPFCFLLGQFQANRALRAHAQDPARPSADTAPDQPRGTLAAILIGILSAVLV